MAPRIAAERRPADAAGRGRRPARHPARHLRPPELRRLDPAAGSRRRLRGGRRGTDRRRARAGSLRGHGGVGWRAACARLRRAHARAGHRGGVPRRHGAVHGQPRLVRRHDRSRRPAGGARRARGPRPLRRDRRVRRAQLHRRGLRHPRRRLEVARRGRGPRRHDVARRADRRRRRLRQAVGLRAGSRSRRPSSSCTAARIGSSPPRTRSSCSVAAPAPSCGCDRATVTSRSWPRCRSRWTGCTSPPSWSGFGALFAYPVFLRRQRARAACGARRPAPRADRVQPARDRAGDRRDPARRHLPRDQGEAVRTRRGSTSRSCSCS